MTRRNRSPSYPSSSLEEAIDFVAKIHKVERSNVIDRGVAAQAMGYTGLSGRSATVLSNLNQYGLLERAGKNEVRVSKLAVEILYPDSPASKQAALREAAEKPELFQKIAERFPDGQPSEASLRSFFVKEGFTDTALRSVIEAYKETFRSVENAIEYESTGPERAPVTESPSNQKLGNEMTMNPRHEPQISSLHPPAKNVERMDFDWPNKRIVISRIAATKAEAKDMIAFMNAMMSFLPDGEAPVAPSKSDDDSAAAD